MADKKKNEIWPGMDFNTWFENDLESDDWIEETKGSSKSGTCAAVIGWAIFAIFLGSCVACL